MSKHFVVIGAGQAAVQTLHSARQHGFEGRISIVGDEAFPPYQRPPLSKKYLAGTFPRERLHLKADNYYEQKQAELLLQLSVDEIDLTRRRVRLSDDRLLDFDYLALATGSRVRRIAAPGAELAGIHYVRSIADIDAIRGSLANAARLVIVGGGYIGLEVAAVTRQLGLEVTVLEAEPRLLARVVCPQVADFYADYHRQAGVKIHCGAQVTGFTGRERVTGVDTADGLHHACDLAIVGIGVVPNVELAEAAGLECNNGIVVDTGARTADAAIVAAGDCANHPHPLAPRRVRLESVNNAVEQGKAAAASLFGEPAPFEEVPWFWSDQYDLKLQIAGLAMDYDEVAIRGAIGAQGFAAYYLADGRPVAVDAVNSPRDFMNAKKLIAARTKLSAAEIVDPASDLSAYSNSA
jgi:3-phenylpropionate/trans-cinnamate dioxygenase ferredoxin reductase subunit